ncbi:MAG: sugar phosphate isomerase/epimerase [Devosiaceae bacterium]|nr:sugar phosphate isomerase/epimerase [Devosiaceae bacterium MH13]
MAGFAYQLYSSRRFGPLRRTLGMLRELGYQGVEGYGALLDDPATVDLLEAGLGATGLAMWTSHISLAQLREDPRKLIEVTRRLGVQTLFVAYLDPAERPSSEAEWTAFAAELAVQCEPLRMAGLTVGWHNHDFEFIALPEGTRPIELLLEGDPSLQWELDIGWAEVVGEDPVAWLERYTHRIAAAHLKDRAPAGENLDEDGWADVGSGTLDWATLLPALRAEAVPQLIVEHDNPADHERFAARSISALRSIERSKRAT